MLLQRLERHGGRRLVALARMGVRAREDVTEVAPALLGVDEQREMPAVLEVDLRPVQRLDARGLRGLGELHRAADAVVVGEREGLVAVRGRGDRELVGQRGAVEEREGGVGVELGVHGTNTCSHAGRRIRLTTRSCATLQGDDRLPLPRRRLRRERPPRRDHGRHVLPRRRHHRHLLQAELPRAHAQARERALLPRPPRPRRPTATAPASAASPRDPARRRALRLGARARLARDPRDPGAGGGRRRRLPARRRRP